MAQVAKEVKPKPKQAKPAKARGGELTLAGAAKAQGGKLTPARAALVKPVVKKTAPKKEAESVRLRIRVRAHDNKILDASLKQIVDTALRHDAKIVGPIPLPTEIRKYSPNRASFVYKNSREQFEIRTHKRIIDVLNPSAKTIEAMTNMSLPSAVEVDIKMI